MWKAVGKPKVVMVTQPMAKRWAEMEPCPNDRPLNRGRMVAIGKVVSSGEFRVCEWASVFCKETARTYRVNGKHTSSALAGMNGEFRPVTVVIEDYEADTLEDVAKLYATFDTRRSVRSAPDIYLAFAAADEGLRDLPKRIISLAASSMAYEKWEVASGNVAAEGRAALLLEHRDFVIWLHGILSGGETDASHLRRAPAAAAMFKTFQRAPEKATDFWMLVRLESGPDRDSPDRVLARWLRSTAVSMGMGARSKKKHASCHEVMVKCVHAWNAWRRGERSYLKYYADKPTPRAI